MGGRGWGAGWYGKVDATSGRTCKKIQEEERLKKENQEKKEKQQKGKASRTTNSRTVNPRTFKCLFAFERFWNAKAGWGDGEQ